MFLCVSGVLCTWQIGSWLIVAVLFCFSLWFVGGVIWCCFLFVVVCLIDLRFIVC